MRETYVVALEVLLCKVLEVSLGQGDGALHRHLLVVSLDLDGITEVSGLVLHLQTRGQPTAATSCGLKRLAHLDLVLQELGEVLGLQQGILCDLSAVEDELEVHLGDLLLEIYLMAGMEADARGFA